MADSDLIDQLARCQSLDEFYELCAPLGLYHGTGPRFLHLELDIVNRCNLRCVMCFHSLESTRRARTVYLEPGAFDAAAARVLPHAHRLSLSLGNEPLMSPHFAEILGVTARYRVPHVNFFTNALLLSDAIIDAIVANGVTQVCVSIEGATAATYNAIRRDGDFDRLLLNVERLVARRDAAGSATPRVRFDIVMMQRNIHELPALVVLADRLGVRQLSFRHLVVFEGLDMERESLTATKALSNYWLDRALTTAADIGLEVQSCPAMFDLDAQPSPSGSPGSSAGAEAPFLPTPYCPFPFFHVSMGPGGHVLPCPYSHNEAPYGRVSADQQLDRVWLNERFTALRRRILRHDPPEMCRRCSFLGDRYPDVASLFATRRN